jgi:hypothetical protein
MHYAYIPGLALMCIDEGVFVGDGFRYTKAWASGGPVFLYRLPYTTTNTLVTVRMRRKGLSLIRLILVHPSNLQDIVAVNSGIHQFSSRMCIVDDLSADASHAHETCSSGLFRFVFLRREIGFRGGRKKLNHEHALISCDSSDAELIKIARKISS